MSTALPAAFGSDRVTRQARGVFLASIALTVGLWVSPWAMTAGYPLFLLSTIAHELGHGITAILVGGEFRSFVVHADGSGVAVTATGSPLAAALVSAGGLIGPAIAAMFFFALGRRPVGARATLAFVGFALLAIDALLMRNVFGGVFVFLVAGTFIFVSWKLPSLSQIGLVFTGVQLALSVFSRGDYLFTPVAETASGPMPSDVAHIAEALILPYWVWGIVCGAVSVFALIVGTLTLLRSKS